MDLDGRDMGEKRKLGTSHSEGVIEYVLSVVRRLCLAEFGDSMTDAGSGDELEELRA